MEQTDIDRFWKYVKKDKYTACWEWVGGINSTGRGIFWLNGKTPKAHRISWVIHYGEIPTNQLILHYCDNGKCVRPEHLFLGTYKDNTQDMLTKGRGNKPKGEDHWNSKLDALEVNSIRGMYLTGVKQKEIAKRMGISQPTVSEIVNHKKRV